MTTEVTFENVTGERGFAAVCRKARSLPTPLDLSQTQRRSFCHRGFACLAGNAPAPGRRINRKLAVKTSAGPQEAAVAHPLKKRPGSRPHSAWGKKCLQRSTHESWVAGASRRQGIATHIVERVFQGFQWHVCTFQLARLERWASFSTGAMSRYPTGLQSEARRFGLTALPSPTLPSVLQSGATPNQKL